MKLPTDEARTRLGAQVHGVLCTLHPERGPDAQPVVYAVSADGHTLALVVRNGDTAASKGFTFDLTALPSVGATADVRRTSRAENLVSLTAVPIQDWSFVATVTPGSVTTFVVTIP